MPIIERLLSVTWTKEEFESMIEDYELSLELLRYFARPDVNFPSNKTIDHLKMVFPDRPEDQLVYHLKHCIDLRLLDGKYLEIPGYGDRQIIFQKLTGLSVKGDQYVQYSNAPIWGQIVDRAAESGHPISTELLVDTMNEMSREFVRDIVQEMNDDE